MQARSRLPLWADLHGHRTTIGHLLNRMSSKVGRCSWLAHPSPFRPGLPPLSSKSYSSRLSEIRLARLGGDGNIIGIICEAWGFAPRASPATLSSRQKTCEDALSSGPAMCKSWHFNTRKGMDHASPASPSIHVGESDGVAPTELAARIPATMKLGPPGAV